MKKISTVRKLSPDDIYHIGKSLDCNSKNTVHLIESNRCGKGCTGSSKTKFCSRVSKCKSTHCKFKNKRQVSKEAFKTKDLPLSLLLRWKWYSSVCYHFNSTIE